VERGYVTKDADYRGAVERGYVTKDDDCRGAVERGYLIKDDGEASNRNVFKACLNAGRLKNL